MEYLAFIEFFEEKEKENSFSSRTFTDRHRAQYNRMKAANRSREEEGIRQAKRQRAQYIVFQEELNAQLAQMEERSATNGKVAGSSPALSAINLINLNSQSLYIIAIIALMLNIFGFFSAVFNESWLFVGSSAASIVWLLKVSIKNWIKIQNEQKNKKTKEQEK